MSSEKKSSRPAGPPKTGAARIINLGFNNIVVKDKIVAVVTPDAAPTKRLKDEARKNNKLIDATSGRRTRAVLITDSDHVILASIQPETIIERFK